jgi:nucleolar GTP-binding protein
LYLEQVRQHLSRLPSIDPNTRTILVCGYPNVGKSSFMNKVTRAEVDVQPYAFTTKSLFVGHMDYKYLRWQVIDTPGILDKPLEERNTIEMQSITALAHLRATVLFFLDISETCGFTIAQQASLFRSIKPLFANKPLLLVLNKIDLVRPEAIPEADKALLQALMDEGVEFAQSSCVTDEGVMDMRNRAADKLLATRVELKMKGQKINDVLNRLHLSVPKARDTTARPAFIPEAVLQRRQAAGMAGERRLARDIEEENGGAGVYSADLKANYLLGNAAWKYDVIPEIMDGKNIADFIDPEIEEKLARLDAEEEAAEEQGAYDESRRVLSAEQKAVLAKVKAMKAKQAMAIEEHRAKKGTNTRPLLLARRKRSRADSDDSGDERMDVDDGGKRARGAAGAIARGKSRSGRELSVAPARDRSVMGLRDDAQLARSTMIRNVAQKRANLHAKRGEADRDQKASKPKHLFSGKRKAGTHDRR